ncbi:MAG: arginine--tRNA ligase [Acidobacteriota bacterium]
MPTPMHDLFSELKAAVTDAVREVAADPSLGVPIENPPDPKLGDLATPVALGLARALRRPPREIAAQIAARLEALPGIAGVEVAGPGFVNLRVDRGAALRRLLEPDRPTARRPGKLVVEHTNINPNKAAHIGHLRNAVLGDTLVRCLRALGHEVEIQNYIDDTGVQVADVVVALRELAGLDEQGFAGMVERAEQRVAEGRGGGIDHDLWDLYARVSAWYAEDAARERHRAETLAALEHGEGDIARLGARVAREVVRCHLRTMDRIGVRYDLLPKESDILRHRFWQAAFERLKQTGAIRLSTEGKTAGCWVMNLPHDEEGDSEHEYEKVIVRSNGVVTYVGKDIAYQMWKFGLLDRDFDYRPFALFRYPDASLWETAPPGEGVADHPPFGGASRVYNVIDVRQSYLQRVVQRGLEVQGFTDQARESIHFAYEMVALSPRTALELNPELELDDDERRRPFLDMSGRRGLGVKADDLIDRLEAKALEEVRSRDPGLSAQDAQRIAHDVACGALRYYMLRFTRNKIVAFDIDAALAFEGETGPYAQYACVRVRRIVEKLSERSGISADEVLAGLPEAEFAAIPPDQQLDHWSLVLLATRLPETVRAAVDNLEFATLARYAFELAQAINAFYHRFPVIREPDERTRTARLAILVVAARTLERALALMGVAVPPRM